MSVEIIDILFNAIVAAGSLLAGIAAVIVIPKTIKSSMFNTPKFELNKFMFDKHTMGQRRSNYKRIAKFYDDENGKITVKGWYLK